MAGEPRAGTLGVRLRSARASAFVGREEEKSAFRALLGHEEPAVVWIFAPGGTGKSALLRELGEIARTDGASTVTIDLSAAEANPDAILHEAEASIEGAQRVVLLIDSYERGIAIDGWVRETLLPVLPDDVILVIAGRNPPSVEWRTDQGSGSLLHVVALGSLDPSASRTLLGSRGVTGDDADALLDLARGHPLTLVLLGEVMGSRARHAVPSSLRDVPEVVTELVARLVHETPSTDQRRALELCAHARQTTEDLMREIVAPDSAHELLTWLRSLPYANVHPHGVTLHPIVRDAIDQDFRWRDPPGYRALHRALGQHLLARVRAAPHLERDRAFLGLLYLRRVSPVARRMFDFDTLGSGWADVPRDDERDGIARLIEEHEGRASADVARYWFDRQREAFTVLRGPLGQPVVVSLHLVLSASIPRDVRRVDPALEEVGRFIDTHGDGVEGRSIVVTRFAAGRDPSSDGRLRHFRPMLLWLTTPSLAFGFTALSNGALWADALVDAGHRQEGRFTVDGRVAPLFVGDFRSESASEWLLRVLLRDLDGAPSPAAKASVAGDTPSLDRTALGVALRHALENFTRADQLQASPLLASRWVQRASGDVAPTPQLLRRLVCEIITSMTEDPRDAKLARALEAAFVHPAPSREAAAERIRVPFSSFRRHLSKGIERLEEMVWAIERGR